MAKRAKRLIDLELNSQTAERHEITQAARRGETLCFFINPRGKILKFVGETAMSYQSETPFDNIESALEYVDQLLGATREAQNEIEMEMVRAANPEMARRKQALQLVNFKLEKLSTHIVASRRILNDLRMLRRLLLEERRATDPSAIS